MHTDFAQALTKYLKQITIFFSRNNKTNSEQVEILKHKHNALIVQQKQNVFAKIKKIRTVVQNWKQFRGSAVYRTALMLQFRTALKTIKKTYKYIKKKSANIDKKTKTESCFAKQNAAVFSATEKK